MAQPLKKSLNARPWFESIATMSVSDFRKLIEKKKKEDRGNASAVINFQDEDKTTALHTACRSHRKELVEILLAEHADPNLEDANGFTPLIVACIEEANEDIIKLLLTAPGISVTAKNVDGSTALHYFAKNYNSPASAEVFRLLVEKGAGVNDRNSKGETPLLLACLPLKARPATARLLLQAGADPNIHSNSGDTPLCWATLIADQELISLFLEKGADPTAKDRAGKTPAEIADANKRANIASMLRQAEQRWIRQKEFDTWMTGLGLTKYLPLFKKEEFDMSSLSEIDEAVLESLQLPRGVRLTFLKARKEWLDQQQKDKPSTSMSSSSSVPTIADRKGTATLLPSTHIINFNDITIGRLLGKGFFAEVREGEYRGSPIAVKIIYRESFRNKGDIELFYQEAEILSKLRFPTVVQFIGICVGDQHCIITEFMKDGSLYQKLHDYPDDILRSHKWQLQIALDIARGMNYLHGLNPPVLHRDLTSKNILLDGKTAKVADFGLSKEKDLAAAMTSSVGALPWAAPEVFKGALFTEAADTYSYGVILWELWTGKDPQGDMAPLAFANKVAHEGFRPAIPASMPGPIKELITRCWDADPKRRPNFDEILKYLKAYEANSNHERHSSSKKDKDKREKSTKKSSSSKPAEPVKAGSEANLLASYGGNPTSSPPPERANSEANLLASYGQEPAPAAAPSHSMAKAASSTDMYINSSFSSAKSQSNPEAPAYDLGKSMSADQLRKHSDSELAARALKTSQGSSQSEGDLVGSGRLRFSSADSATSATPSPPPIPTIAVPPATAPAPESSGSGGRSSGAGAGANSSGAGANSAPGKHQLRQFHERYGNGPVIFHNPSAPKNKNASPTHLRRVSMDEGNRSPDVPKDSKPGGADSPKGSKP